MRHSRITSIAAIALVSTIGCHGDFLTGGDLTSDPNRPNAAQPTQLLQGAQADLWALWGSEPARVTGMWAQQFIGGQNQYNSIYSYNYDEGTTQGFYSGLYSAGGLVDIVKIEKAATADKNATLLGIADVVEGAVMGTGADLFGNIVYSEALSGKPNPKLDDQMTVYDSVQKVLTAGITNLAQPVTGTNVSPAAADIVYNGDPAKWTALAHTLKARFYMHTAEINGTAAYTAALAEAKQGIASDAGDYVGAFTASAGEQNFYYQFIAGAAGRTGYLLPNPGFISLLQSRNDPRASDYFSASGANLSATRIAANFKQPFVSYDENTLIWAEAAYRTGDPATALAKLNEERANHALPAEVVSGTALLNEILIEKYIADFQLGEEAWNDFKRTCTPNLSPATSGRQVPGRMYYDANERLTNTNIPTAGQGVNGSRNVNDPVNTLSDGTGASCLGG